MFSIHTGVTALALLLAGFASAASQRTGQIVRRMLYRGWIRDTTGTWHQLDSQGLGAGPGQIVNKAWDKTADGWLTREMGGIVHREYLQSGQVVTVSPPATTPAFMTAAALAGLEAAPPAVDLQRIVARPDGTLDVVFNLTGNPAPVKVSLYHGNLIDASPSAACGFYNGVTGRCAVFGSAREADAQTPVAAGGSNASTWTTFTDTPQAGGGTIHFAGGTAEVDPHGFNGLAGTAGANWTLYYSIDGATTWTALGAAQPDAAATGVIYQIEIHTDLGVNDPWAPVAAETDDLQVIRHTRPPGRVRHFVRLAVSLPEPINQP